MKIALLTDGITPFVTGGMQRHSANLAKYFTIEGVEVTLVHCVPFGENLPSDSDINKSLFNDSSLHLDRIITLNFPKSGKIPGHYLKESYKYSKEIFNSLNWHEYDFVYAKGFCGWYYLEQKNKGVKLPLIGVKFHGYEMFQNLPSLSQKLKAKLLQKPTIWNNQNADVIFSYGGKITDIIIKYCKVSKDKIFEFTSGIDNVWIRTSDIQTRSKKIKFVFLGRDEKRKGLNEINETIKSLGQKDYEFHFIGPIKEEMKIKLENAFYYGKLISNEKICKVLDQMDVLVCPSHSEGMPNVILEGMARGLAVLATDVGAVEMLVSEKNGFLISPHNTKQLKNKTIEFINLPVEKLQFLKYNSLEIVKYNFDWKHVIQEKISLIKNLTIKKLI